MTLRPPPRIVDDPSVAETLRRELSQLPKSAAMPSGYDVAAGLARFEGSLGITAGTSASSSGSGATARAANGSGVSAAVATGAGLKGVVILSAVLGLAAVGAGVASYKFYGRSAATTARDTAATAPVVAVTLGEGASAPVATSTSSAMDFARDTELELVEAAKPAKVRATSSASMATRAAKSLDSSATTESAPESQAAVPTGDLPNKASRSTELAEEMEQLSRLRSLATSDPAAALRLSEQGDQRFVKGLFRQERQAIAIQSLAQLHRTSEAKQRARAFATAYPRSPFLARMTELLGNDNE